MKRSIKKLVSVLLVLVMMIPVGAIAAFADSNANATPKYSPNMNWGPNEDGIFEIATPEDLLAFANDEMRKKHSNYEDKTIVLTADIDLNPGWDASTKEKPTNEWIRMQYMKGTLDGQGHTIRGIYIAATGDDAVFIRNTDGGSTIKNLRFENSYFHAVRNNAGLFGYARGAVVCENVYMDAICESDTGHVGAFVSWFRATGGSQRPTVTLKNCVFAGTVTGKTAVGAFVGTNDRPATNEDGQASGGDKGAGTYSVTMTDCANYGTITCTGTGMAAGLIGNCANEATLTRCYNAGTVGTALVNVNKSTSENTDGKPVVITLEDCYYLAGTDVVATTKSITATATVVVKYDGAAADAVKSATATELVALDAFKKTSDYAGWTVNGSVAVPAALGCLGGTHDYVAETAVAPDRCIADGYTPYTCSKCGNTKKDNIVAKAAHNYVANVVAPTCAEKGYTEHKCSVCDDTYKDNEVDALAHTESDWIVDKAATEEFAGLRHKECTLCKEVLADGVIPVLSASGSQTETESDTEAVKDSETEASDNEMGGCGISIALGSAFSMITMMSLGATMLRKKEK